MDLKIVMESGQWLTLRGVKMYQEVETSGNSGSSVGVWPKQGEIYYVDPQVAWEKCQNFKLPDDERGARLLRQVVLYIKNNFPDVMVMKPFGVTMVPAAGALNEIEHVTRAQRVGGEILKRWELYAFYMQLMHDGMPWEVIFKQNDGAQNSKVVQCFLDGTLQEVGGCADEGRPAGFCSDCVTISPYVTFNSDTLVRVEL